MNPNHRRDRLASLRDVGENLRDVGETPDLTDQILGRVETARPFLDHRARRLVWVTRFGVGGALLLIVGGVALVQQLAPGTISSPASAPLSAVVDNAQVQTATSLATLRQSIESIESIESVEAELRRVLAPEPAEINTTGETDAPTIAGAMRPDDNVASASPTSTATPAFSRDTRHRPTTLWDPNLIASFYAGSMTGHQPTSPAVEPQADDLLPILRVGYDGPVPR